MFENKEQYQEAFAKATDKSKFMQEHGTGDDLPTVAELASTVRPGDEDYVDTSEMEFIPKDQFDPSTLPTEAEPATNEELDQYAKYEKESRTAANMAQIEANLLETQMDYAQYDDQGNVITDEEGNIVERKATTGELMINSLGNILTDINSQFTEVSIGVNELAQALLGDETIEKWAEDPGMVGDFWGAFTQEETDKLLEQVEVEKSRRDNRTGTFTEGENQNIPAAIVNGIASVASSAFVNTVTLGGGLVPQFIGSSYKEYNEALAEEKGKTLEQLRADGEDEIIAPATVGVLQGLSEKFGLKGAGKAIGSKIKSSIGKQITHRLVSGQAEGVTEVIQTGLEKANVALAKGENAAEAFANGVFSKEGAEAYLQGMVGGATLAGKGQDAKANIQSIQKAAAGIRSDYNNRRVEEGLKQISKLQQMKKTETDPNVKIGINEQLKHFRMDVKQAVEEDNELLRHFSNDQIEKAGSIVDAAKGFVDMGKELAEKRKNGEITQEVYDAAREGLQQKLDAKKEQLGKLVDKALVSPKVRNKDLTTPNATGVWNAGLKNKVDDIINEKGAEGTWDIIQDNDFQNFVGAKIQAQWNKIPSDLKDATSFQDVMNEVMYGGTIPPSQTIHGTFKAYKQEGKAKPSTYFLGNIDKKILGAIKVLTQQETSNKQQVGRTSGTTQSTSLDETGRGIIDEDATIEIGKESGRRRTALEQAEKLGVGAAFTDKIKGKMETLIGQKEINPADKKFETNYVNRFRDQIAPDVKKAMGKKQDYVDYLTQHGEGLVGIFPARTLAKRRNDPAFEWIENPPTAQEFIDYHLPKKADGSKDTVLESKRKNALANAIAEGIGFRAMEDTLAENKDTTFRDSVNAGFDNIINKLRELQGERGTLQSNPLAIAPAVLEGALLATKAAFNGGMNMADAIAEGYKKIADKVDFESFKRYIENQIKALKSPTSWAEMSQARVEQEIKVSADMVQNAINGLDHSQFQESTEATEGDLESQIGAYKDILERHKVKGGIINHNDPKQRAEAQEWVRNVLTKYLPQGFFHPRNLVERRQGFFKLAGEIKDIKSQVQGDGGVDWANTGKVNWESKTVGGKKVHLTPQEIQAKWADPNVQARQEANTKALELFANAIDQMVKDDPQNARFIAGLLMGMSNNKEGVMRLGAPMRGTSLNFSAETGVKYGGAAGAAFKVAVEEHTMPQSVVARYILNTALDPNEKMDNAYKNIKKNFFQIMLSIDDDNKLSRKRQVGTTKSGKAKFETMFNYINNMPKGWKPTDSAWGRYFNDLVNDHNGGIDPNGIYLFDDGMTVAQKFGAAPMNADMAYHQSVVEETQPKIEKEAGENFIQHLSKLWPSANITTDPNEAATRIRRHTGNKVSQEAALAYVQKTNGFADPDGEIYIDTTRHPLFYSNTAIHELGHVWSRGYYQANPDAWAEGIAMIAQSRYGQREINRILDYYPDMANDPVVESVFNIGIPQAQQTGDWSQVVRAFKVMGRDYESPAWLALDEMFAGAIGQHGEFRLKDFDGAQAKNWQQWLNNFTSWIGDLLGFKKPKNATQFMDMALADILGGEAKKSVLSDQYKDIRMKRINQDVKNRTLAAFDFDDTLFKTNSQVVVNNPDGTFELLPTDKFPGHKLKPGQTYDFAQFNQVIEPQALQTFNVLKKALDAGDQVTIVTARAPEAGPAVMQLLEHELGKEKARKIKFIGVGSSTAQAKVNYITRATRKYGYNNVYFADDAIKNTDAVAEALDAMPEVRSKVEHIKADMKVDNYKKYLKGEITWKQYNELAKKTHAETTQYMKPDAWFQFTADLKQAPVDPRVRVAKAEIARIANSAMNPKDKEAYLKILRADLAKINTGIPGFSFDMKQAPENVVKKAQQNMLAEKMGDPVKIELAKVLANAPHLKTQAPVPDNMANNAIQEVNSVYVETGNIDTAIEAGFQQVKDLTDRTTWAKYIADSIEEVKPKPTGAQLEMAFAIENAPEVQQEATFDAVFNQIIEQKTKGEIKADKIFTHKAQLGKPGRIGFLRSIFLNPFADDFKGLLYNILPSGKEGDAAWKFFDDNLMRPYQRAMSQLNAKRSRMQDGYSRAGKFMSASKLTKKIPGTNYTNNNAARVALAIMNGQDPKGIPAADQRVLMAHVQGNPNLKAYVNKVNELFDGAYEWNENATNFPLGDELRTTVDKVFRPQLMEEFQHNADQIFTPENMLKIEAATNPEVRKYLEQKLEAMKTGRNRRTTSNDRMINGMMNWINSSVGVIMFMNMRSAALQLLSTFNYWNAGGNNFLRAAAHMANVPQFRKDLKALWNSDYAVGRRGNLGFDISANEIADAGIEKGGLNNLFAKIANAGFMPTQVMDSVATVLGGASYYRSRINDLMKQGVPKAEAEQQAYQDWVDMTEEGQQSSDPIRVSALQGSSVGRLMFAFGNTPFQYARVVKRAVQDVANGRGSLWSNLKRIAWYGPVQSAIFVALQQALWLGDDEEKERKADFALWGAIGSNIKALGLGGLGLSTTVSIIREFMKEEGRKDYNNIIYSMSPPISKKIRQMNQGLKGLKKGMDEDDWWKKGRASAELFEFATNLPSARLWTKMENLGDLVDSDMTASLMLMKMLGWSDSALSRKDFEAEQGKKDKGGIAVPEIEIPEIDVPEIDVPEIEVPPIKKLDNGIKGEANDDGTIQIDPNLKGEERKKVIKHEEKHIEEMDSGKLSYTDKSLKYNGKSYERKDGKINYNGKWLPEGSSEFPWEAAAEKAEKSKSPIKKKTLKQLYS